MPQFYSQSGLIAPRAAVTVNTVSSVADTAEQTFGLWPTPANYFQLLDTIQLSFPGHILNQTTVNISYKWRLYFGAVLLAVGNAALVGSSTSTKRRFPSFAEIIIHDATHAKAQFSVLPQTVDQTELDNMTLAATAVGAVDDKVIDLTVANDIKVTMQMGGAVTSDASWQAYYFRGHYIRSTAS